MNFRTTVFSFLHSEFLLAPSLHIKLKLLWHVELSHLKDRYPYFLMSENSKDSTKEQLGRLVSILTSAGVMQLDGVLNLEEATGGLSDISFEELGVDSFTFIVIAVEIEDNYGVSMTPEKVDSLKTVMGLFSYLQNGGR